MESTETLYPGTIGRLVGWSLIGTIIVGIVAARFVAPDININLSADVTAVAESMLEAEQRLRARAYLLVLTFGLEALISVGFFLLLRRSGPLLAGWSLFVGLAASLLMLLGAVFALNAAEIAGDSAYGTMAGETRLMLASLQATSDYTSFHLGLVLSATAKAGFFTLFLRSNLIPKIIAGWGLFASLFVAVTIVARDFIPMLGHGTITMAFMLSNLIALVSTGLYLGIRGVRTA
ncbi:DUF4386 domain-containing protein [Parasphingopyxis algicola]|uniref:DUF4386 domain-containing protein n=1 Tax=Parasphingopyxis algicola TaxID=2026624 RepID=UPI0015A00B72|nr:DUF4386 domain-containing protein [Parasphingopyxis algicola]QLC26129.1 DUF4386 domain-containing protein [Parasphingopyxis algicola]